MKKSKTLKKARSPFHFYARLSLTLATGNSVSDAEGLLNVLKTCPDSVIYAHAHRFLQAHQFAGAGPSNDFSVWASYALGDEELAEKLGVIEPLGYPSLEDLRKDVISALERHIQGQQYPRKAQAGRELHILSSTRFSIPTGETAWDLRGFVRALKKASPATVYLHAFESRLRSAKGVSDFSVWLKEELEEGELAREIGGLNPHAQTLAELKRKILEMTQKRMEAQL